MGAMQAAIESIRAVTPGLSLTNILSNVGSELGRFDGQRFAMDLDL
jgi:hypothetical protein